MKKKCPICNGVLEHWGRTAKGLPRFYCLACRVSSTRKKDAVEKKHLLYKLDRWLGGKDSLSKMALKDHKTRQALWKRLHPLMREMPEPVIPPQTKARVLILDGTYVHGHSLCALVAIDEDDNLYWRFAPYESLLVWSDFLSSFAEPEVVIMDGQKGLFAATRGLWPNVPIQRCQFHVVAFALQYTGRRPKEEASIQLIGILYKLKYAKTNAGKEMWMFLYKAWEKKYARQLIEKNESGNFRYPKLRSARLIVRRALPNIFTFLNHEGCPNTTNLVEGWVNSAVAEALRMHRGLRMYEKRALVSIVLSHLKRGRRKAVQKAEDGI